MEDNAISKVLDLLTSQLYANLGTQNEDGTPWISNVFYSVDKDLNLLWYSRNITQHSQNILRNPIVALNIVRSSDPENVDALYIQAEVKEIENMIELGKSLIAYGKKLLAKGFVSKLDFEKFSHAPMDFLGKSKFRMYKAEIKNMWKYVELTSWKDKFIDGRVELPIKDLREQFQQL